MQDDTLHKPCQHDIYVQFFSNKSLIMSLQMYGVCTSRQVHGKDNNFSPHFIIARPFITRVIILTSSWPEVECDHLIAVDV